MLPLHWRLASGVWRQDVELGTGNWELKMRKKMEEQARGKKAREEQQEQQYSPSSSTSS
jgi:hypothetical protein